MKSNTTEPAQQDRLQEFLQNVDPALLASLRQDERRRRHKLITLTITGGLVMGSVIAILLMSLLNNAPNVSPKDADRALALSNEAWQLWQRRDFASAADKFDQALKLDPTNANAWNGLGWARLNGGEQAEAEKAFAKCVELEPKNGAALNGLGVIAFNQKQFDQAEKHWLAAADSAPAAWFGLAKLSLLQGKYDDAAKWAQKILDQEPNDPVMTAVLAAAKSKAVPNDLRAQLQPNAAAGNAMSPDTARGWAFFNRGQLNQAKAAFQAALATDDKDFAARNGLAFTLLNLGHATEAKPLFERLLKDQPDAAGPMNGLARCLAAEGKTDDAIALWQLMLKKYPGPNAATGGLAWTYYERKEYAKAVPLFEEMLKQSPEDPNLKQALARAKSGGK
jgi:superkiller protein 3